MGHAHVPGMGQGPGWKRMGDVGARCGRAARQRFCPDSVVLLGDGRGIVSLMRGCGPPRRRAGGEVVADREGALLCASREDARGEGGEALRLAQGDKREGRWGGPSLGSG